MHSSMTSANTAHSPYGRIDSCISHMDDMLGFCFRRRCIPLICLIGLIVTSKTINFISLFSVGRHLCSRGSKIGVSACRGLVKTVTDILPLVLFASHDWR